MLWRAFDKTVRRKPLAGCGGRGVLWELNRFRLGSHCQKRSCAKTPCIGQPARPDLVILVVGELLSQEQDFRRYFCPGMGDDVHELQSIPQQFPEHDKDGADVTPPGDLKPKHGSSASHTSRVTELPRFLRGTAAHENGKPLPSARVPCLRTGPAAYRPLPRRSVSRFLVFRRRVAGS